MPKLFSNFTPTSRRYSERSKMSTSAKNACQREQLEKYMSTLEKQHRRDNSFLIFKQRKFASRQEKVLGISFQSHSPLPKTWKKKEGNKALLSRKAMVDQERKMSADSDGKLVGRLCEYIDPDKSLINRTKLRERRVLSAGGKPNQQTKEKRTDELKDQSLFSNGVGQVLDKVGSGCNKEDDSPPLFTEQLEDDNIEFVNQEQRNLTTDVQADDNDCLESRENKLVEETIKIDECREEDLRKSISLPEIVTINKLDGNICLKNVSRDFKADKKTKKSKKIRKGKKRQHQKQRTSNQLSQSTSLPDVRTKTSRVYTEPKLTNKTKGDAQVVLPRVARKKPEVNRENPEGTINLSVVCRVLQIKNNFTKRKRKEKQQKEERREEITAEVWESLKNCRYLRVSDREITPELAF